MGRKPSKPNAIPRLRARKRGGKTWFYYDHGGKPRREEALGCDYGLAIQKWAVLEREGDERPRAVMTFKWVADRYRAEVIPTKAPRTQRDNLGELAHLIDFFDDPPIPLDMIEPQHVNQYMRWRKAPIRATRDKALLSHLWNWARGMGYTKLPNPCAGIMGTKAGRDVYIEDDVYAAVYERAGQPLRDAMDLAYLAGQRVTDTLQMDQRHVRGDMLHVKQGKTEAKRRIAIVGELAALLDRIAARKSGYRVHATRLIVGEDGQPMTYRRLNEAFVEARTRHKISLGIRRSRRLRATSATGLGRPLRRRNSVPQIVKAPHHSLLAGHQKITNCGTLPHAMMLKAFVFARGLKIRFWQQSVGSIPSTGTST